MKEKNSQTTTDMDMSIYDIDKFYNRIYHLLIDMGKNWSWLATVTPIKRTTILNWKANRRIPDAFSVVQIAKVLNTTVEYLVLGEK